MCVCSDTSLVRVCVCSVCAVCVQSVCVLFLFLGVFTKSQHHDEEGSTCVHWSQVKKDTGWQKWPLWWRSFNLELDQCWMIGGGSSFSVMMTLKGLWTTLYFALNDWTIGQEQGKVPWTYVHVQTRMHTHPPIHTGWKCTKARWLSEINYFLPTSSAHTHTHTHSDTVIGIISFKSPSMSTYFKLFFNAYMTVQPSFNHKVIDWKEYPEASLGEGLAPRVSWSTDQTIRPELGNNALKILLNILFCNSWNIFL